ncbi:glycoside hydrolase family 38 C-terminal domain-containing protein [Flavitalea sp. BT771]|uniref:glycoside hydrolase family 38 N-terminal domain-containing protein n=1 Tax=Flavitalea sp. BT771 TaxID=3063329 RepID=UPI0026E1FF30|nr:glycosyl hydrolase-related protein [Flavitalea sp. BT771]MDO6432200.1 glycoside hydrolase family 38 C-terminal domain-containing protein [Flavitalea sp. BT771]MDV6221110.1 glycoside hydrolase family 38 C-terminal domain-containing protein [Flavitalea sp. BT771]
MIERIKIVVLLAVALVPGSSHGQGMSHDYFTGGMIHVVPSSHQDIAWMDTPDSCKRFRDLFVITPALRRLKESRDFRFSVENALNLYEYLERHPDRLPEIAQYTREGRLEWGATYNQPYEGLYDGEALIREVYYGKKKLEKLLPGGKFTCAWSEDVPGRSLQTAQIFSKAGIRYLQFSRFQPGVYRWYSPDGSHITCWTPGQYEESGRVIRGAGSDAERTAAFADKLSTFNDYYKRRSLPPDLIYISSEDFSEPLDYDAYFAHWNKEVGDKRSDLPLINYATGSEALEALTAGKGRIDSVMGEYPNLWLYIHGPTHEKAVRAGRLAARLLTAAEKFSVVDGVLKGSFSDYPQGMFDNAWQHAIYPDHGWGGVHGDSTDMIFAKSYGKAACLGDSILRSKLQRIAKSIKYKDAGKAIIVFNALSWSRTDPVQATVSTEGIYDNAFRLLDEQGHRVDYQVISSPGQGPDARLTISFIARDVPSIGYATYYLVPGQAGDAEKLAVNITGNVIDTRFYKVELAGGGIKSIFDKTQQRELIAPGRLLAGEVFSLRSVGNGAGEFTSVQQPTMEGFERMGQYNAPWSLVENGPVRTVLETVHPWRNCTVRQRVIFYTMVRRIDFQADIIGFNGERSREFRMAFPLNMDSARVGYEVPMGIVEVGKSELPFAPGFSKPEQIYNTPCREVHPREVQDWFGAWDNRGSVTISSDVAVFDWIDPTGPNDKPVLQPLLLASRRSCNESPLANWYLQRGDHHFTFSLFSSDLKGRPDWKDGKQAAQPLMVVDDIPDSRSRTTDPGAVLPERYSFAGVDKGNIVISAIKKNDDLDKIILRCYDMEGRDTEAVLSWFKGIHNLAMTNIIEQSPVAAGGKGTVSVNKYSIETFQFDAWPFRK